MHSPIAVVSEIETKATPLYCRIDHYGAHGGGLIRDRQLPQRFELLQMFLSLVFDYHSLGTL